MISAVSRPFLVIVSGVPGAGKTTLAEKLGKRIAVPVLGKDVIKSGISRTEGVAATHGGPIGERTFASLFECARVLLDARCSLIIEAAFHRSRFEVEAAPLLALAQARLICCSVDTALATQRFETRARAGGAERFAHPDELIIDMMRSGSFGWDAYDLAPLGLASLVVDTTDSYLPGIDEIVDFATRRAT
jgi:predicted kinase